MENMVNTNTGMDVTAVAPAAEAQVMATPVAPMQPDMSNYMLKTDAQKRTKRGALVGAGIGLGVGVGGTILGTKIGKWIANGRAKRAEAKQAKQLEAAQQVPQLQTVQITAEQLAQLNAIQAAQAQTTPEPAPAQAGTADTAKKK